MKREELDEADMTWKPGTRPGLVNRRRSFSNNKPLQHRHQGTQRTRYLLSDEPCGFGLLLIFGLVHFASTQSSSEAIVTHETRQPAQMPRIMMAASQFELLVLPSRIFHARRTTTLVRAFTHGL